MIGVRMITKNYLIKKALSRWSGTMYDGKLIIKLRKDIQ